MTIWSSRLLSLLRIIAALLFMEHGLMKLFQFPVAQAGVPDPLPTMLVIAGVIELVGGALLTVGLFMRAVAFLCAGEMAVAYLIGHLPSGFWPGANGGSEAILYRVIFLYLVAAGAGDVSIDAHLRRRAASGHPMTR